MLWLCLRLPLLPLEVFTQNECSSPQHEHPAAVIERQRILVCNSSATATGIKAGISLATAQALCPTANIFDRDTQQESLALKALAYDCYRFTPAITIQSPDCLLLEIRGCLKLFNSLQELLIMIHKAITDQGHYHSSGLSSTPKAAALFSHSDIELSGFFDDTSGALRDATSLQRHLYALPLDTLDPHYCSPKLKAKFRATGFYCLGDLLQLPGSALGKRYGKDFLMYLKQLTGEIPDPQVVLELPPYFDHELHFDNTIISTEVLIFPVKRLLSALCGYLYGRQLHCSKIRWRMKLVGGTSDDLELHFARPQNNLEHFLSLSRLQLENRMLSSPVMSLALHAAQLHPAEQDNVDLFAQQTGSNQNGDITAVLDKLRARLGSNAVQSLDIVDSHIPEQAWQMVDFGKASSSAACSHRHWADTLSDAQPDTRSDTQTDSQAVNQAVNQEGIRPLWLLENPAPVQVRDQRLYWRGELELLQGPERIDGNWWQQPICRDYFVARHHKGALYWIYRDRLTNNWFVHGAFG